jgi:hypothetical protein
MVRYFFAPRYLIRTTIDADEVSEIKAFWMKDFLGKVAVIIGAVLVSVVL